MKQPPFLLFDLPADKSKADFNLILGLAVCLSKNEEFDYEPYLSIENATVERIKALHEAHKKARKK